MRKDQWKLVLKLYEEAPEALDDDYHAGIQRHGDLIREWIESDLVVKVLNKGDWMEVKSPLFTEKLSYKLGDVISA